MTILRAPQRIALTLSVVVLAACARPASHQLQLAEPPAPGTPLRGERPRYPEMLRTATVSGEVALQVRVDRAGRVVPGSVLIQRATHPIFATQVWRVVATWEFAPGHRRGAAERTLPLVVAFVLAPDSVALTRCLRTGHQVLRSCGVVPRVREIRSH